MKKGISCLCALTFALLISGVKSEKRDDQLLESTIDEISEKSKVEKKSIRNNTKSANEDFAYSKMYAQYAKDSDNNYYLRFATALSGNLGNITYTRSMEGKEDKQLEVTTLYKRITANEETMYNNGSDNFDFKITSASDYYWACYTIKLKNYETYHAQDITLTLNVNGNNIASKTTSLDNIVNASETISLGDYAKLVNSENIEPTTKSFSEWKAWVSNVIQGGCTDGTNLYFVFSNGTCTSGKVIKYDIANKTTLNTSSEFTLSSSSLGDKDEVGNIAYVNGKLFVIANNSKVIVLDASTLEIEDSEVSFTLPSGVTSMIRDIEYNANLKKYVLMLKDGSLYFYNDNYELLSYDSSKISSLTSGYNLRALNGNEDYIYVYENKSSVNALPMQVFDWNGNFVSKMTLKDIALPENESNTNYRIQSLVQVGNDIYIGRNSWGWGNVSFILKNTLDTSNLTSTKVYKNLSLGEYVEYQTQKEKEISFNVRNVKSKYSETLTVNDQGGTNVFAGIQSVCADDNYAYFTVNTSVNYRTLLIKYDLKTHQEVKRNILIIGTSSSWNPDNANIALVDDYLLLVNGENKLIKISTDSLEQVEFNNSLTNVKAVTYNKKSNKIAVTFATGNTKFYDKNFNLLNGLFTAKTDTLQTVTSNDNYIYVVDGKDNADKATIDIYSWNGTLVKENVEIKDKFSDKMFIDKVAGNFNIQCIFEINNRLFASIYDFGNSNASYIYEITFNN